jgi:replicative DNA helicase
MSKDLIKEEIERKELFNIEAEQTVLGTIILNNEYLNRVSEFLLEEHFYEPAHQKIYAQIQHNIEKINIIANQVTLKQFFESEPSIKAIGGSLYLSTLLSNASQIIDIADYGKLIYDLALKRELVMIGEDIVVKAYKSENKISAEEQIEAAETKLFHLTESGGSKKDFVNIASSLAETLKKTHIAKTRDSHISGVSTGFVDLDKILSGMQQSDLIILAGRPSMGKAQPLDAKILTISGWKKMGDLKIGDKIASIDGKNSKVKAIFPQGEKQIYRITFSDGRSTECCAEHLWKVNCRHFKEARILSTKQIIELLTKKRYQKRIWIDTLSGDFGNDKKLPLDPWLLGALIVDGTLSGSAVRFSTASKEMLKTLAKKVGKDFKVKHAGKYDYRIIQSAGSHLIGVNGVSKNSIKESLKKLKLWDISSAEKFIPEQYFQASRTSRLELLQGLIDTDGWVEKSGSLRFSTVSKKLADDVVALARSLGAVASLSVKQTSHIYKNEKKSGLPSFVINISHINQKDFASLLDKKTRMQQGRTRQKRLNIVKIESSRKAEAQCISVTHPSHLYITDDYVVTHNTALAINMAIKACEFLNKDAKEKKAVGFFSLEMSADQLAARILSMKSSINATKFRTGQINEMEWEAIARDSAEISKMPFFIDDTPALSIAAIRTRARRLVRKHNLSFLLIDYLQLVRGSSERSKENRVQEISEITQGLKAIAKEFNIPVLALSQLSRAVEQREDKRPQLSDLRESGSIEQDADVVAFIYRESYYHERKKPIDNEKEKLEAWSHKMREISHVADVIIAKQRNGPVGSVSLFFDSEFTRFGDLAQRSGIVYE